MLKHYQKENEIETLIPDTASFILLLQKLFDQRHKVFSLETETQNIENDFKENNEEAYLFILGEAIKIAEHLDFAADIAG